MAAQKVYRIAAYWEMAGWLDIPADSLEEAILIAEATDTPLPEESFFVEDSFEVDREATGEGV